MSGTAPVARRSRRPVARCVLVAVIVTLAALHASAAPVEVRDDTGAPVALRAPAQRIVSLAPHTTELLFAAGAGDRIVGADEFSDYPDAAKSLPRVGSSALVDLERIAAMKPDLVVVWRNGTAAARIESIRALGVPVYLNEPHTLADVASTLVRLGTLAGTEAQARSAARAYQARVDALAARFGALPRVTVFWQVWARPLLTINARHMISDALRVCAGTNVFAALDPLVPSVSVEAVVAADPDAIVTTTNDATAAGRDDDGLGEWRALPTLRATRDGNLIALSADTIHRPSPRAVDGVEALCTALDGVRARAGASPR